jgi:hypothetical protein
MNYPLEVLGEDDDDGQIVDNVDTLRANVIGHRIVKAEQREVPTSRYVHHEFVLTLDSGKQVVLRNTSDCCAYTELEAFTIRPDLIDHVITGVGTTEGYTKWHIYADFGDIIELNVGWSCGNPFYYAYGFSIAVEDVA